MTDQSLSLSKQEIVSLSLIADTNGDGQIDYEEFMKHFTDFLQMVRFQAKIDINSSEIMTKLATEREIKRKELEDKKKQEED